MKILKFTVVLVGLSFLMYLLTSAFIVKGCVVKGQSMAPTLYDNQVLYIKKYVRTYKQGDIISLVAPDDGGFCVKRIIAVEGQTVDLKSDGWVYVDGKRLDEPYLPHNTKTFSFKYYTERFVCGKDEFFVLGDNRPNSADSREYGLIPRKNIVGLIQD